MNKYKLKLILLFFACGAIIALFSGCSRNYGESQTEKNFIEQKTDKYSDETAKAIVEGSIYISSSIFLAAFIRGLLNK